MTHHFILFKGSYGACSSMTSFGYDHRKYSP